MTSWHSYPSLFNLGHRAVKELTDHQVVVQEKVDGSQFSFGLFEVVYGGAGEPGPPEWELKVRSRGAQMNPDAPEKMFTKAVEQVKLRQHLLNPGWTYRGEYLRTPKHNSLAYDRTPAGNVILFDINTGHETYLTPDEVRFEANRIGLECVAELARGTVPLAQLREILDNTVSVLGGQKVEGIVIKPLDYHVFGQDKKVLMGKFVSEAFKEVHAGEWKKNNPSVKDIIERLGEDYRTPARWAKAVQHMKEEGVLDGSPKDIGNLIRAVQFDIKKEETDPIKEALFAHAWPHMARMVIRGLPEWYKTLLMEQQFSDDTAVDDQARVSTNTLPIVV
jgi:hypothetical protein